MLTRRPRGLFAVVPSPFALAVALAVAAIVLAVLAILAPAAAAKPRPLLERGDRSQQVRDLQWLLAGHKPSRYQIATFHHKPNGLFGPRTAQAVIEMKRRLGFPTSALKPVAGDDLVEILTGKRARPLGYLNRATKRLAASDQIQAARASSACAKRAIHVARGELGVHEIPDGSNDSPRIRVYQSVTGAYHAPWCASFVQWALRTARIGYPRAWASAIADNSAGVFYIVQWARTHGWLSAIPKPGNLAAFVDGLGHIGIVQRVTRDGYWTVEGNASNQVLERYHPFGGRPTLFVGVPGCAQG